MSADFHSIAQDILSRWSAAGDASDAHGIASLFTEDAGCVTRVGVFLDGRDAIEQGHVRTFARVTFKTVKVELLRVRALSPDSFVAFAKGIIASSGVVEGELSNLYTLVLIKKDEGWRIAAMQNTGVSTPT